MHPDVEALLNATFPMRGPCAFCETRQWARHRIADAVRGFARAGCTPEQIQREYPHLPLAGIRALIALNPQAYGWWLRSEGRAPREQQERALFGNRGDGRTPGDRRR